jgi:uncharacterized membrane protein
VNLFTYGLVELLAVKVVHHWSEPRQLEVGAKLVVGDSIVGLLVGHVRQNADLAILPDLITKLK